MEASILDKSVSGTCCDSVETHSVERVAVADLPPLHRDPFDRILVAQSIVEGITLLTTDPRVAQYPGAVRRV